jgi:hypothetical protein
MAQKFKDVNKGGVTERHQIMSIACDGLDTRYQGKDYLPFEYGNRETAIFNSMFGVLCNKNTVTNSC